MANGVHFNRSVRLITVLLLVNGVLCAAAQTSAAPAKNQDPFNRAFRARQ